MELTSYRYDQLLTFQFEGGGASDNEWEHIERLFIVIYHVLMLFFVEPN